MGSCPGVTLPVPSVTRALVPAVHPRQCQRWAPAAMAAAARWGPLPGTGVSALCYEMMSRASVHDDSVTSAPPQPISAGKVGMVT